MMIDATIPPPTDAKARDYFERVRPPNPEIRLADFVAQESQPLVEALPPLFFGSKLVG